MTNTNSTPEHRYGGPFDRGRADCYYGRPRTPHYYAGATGLTHRIHEAAMTPEEIAEYHAGYDDAAEDGEQKDWGEEGPLGLGHTVWQDEDENEE